MPKPIDISVVIPTRRGGALLERVARRVLEQRTERSFELLLVDSGSGEDELDRLAALGARIERIEPDSFDHGATRDHGARLARGRILVFLNQDALPVGEKWLDGLTAPFEGPTPPAAVQGAIREFPEEELARDGRRRFAWDSGGPRFYFTRESRGWIGRHGGIGFSTVHCALLRQAWERIPFGTAAILEDKRWQQRASAAGLALVEVEAERALVWHSHDYDLRALVRRCVSEGFGWRGLGERYRLTTALSDALGAEVWREWRQARRRGALHGPAELLFPVVRPLALWWGNRWARRVLH
jgi:rhamnosyltransferase